MEPSPAPLPSLRRPVDPVRNISTFPIFGPPPLAWHGPNQSLSVFCPQCWVSRWWSWRCSSSPWSLASFIAAHMTPFPRPHITTTSRTEPPCRPFTWSMTSERGGADWGTTGQIGCGAKLPHLSLKGGEKKNLCIKYCTKYFLNAVFANCIYR